MLLIKNNLPEIVSWKHVIRAPLFILKHACKILTRFFDVKFLKAIMKNRKFINSKNKYF